MITQAQPLTTLMNEKYINLTTFRKSGATVATPLWFAEYAGVLYAQTFPTAGKLKRIQHTARVTIAPCTLNGKELGPDIEGSARIITDEQEILLAEATLALKYGLTRRIYLGALRAYGKLRRQAPARNVYIAIESVTSAQQSFRAQDLSNARGYTRKHTAITPLFFNW